MSALLLCGCSEDDFLGLSPLTAEQQALIGRAVNFNPSMAEEFAETRVTYNHDGKFNEGDMMQIYRQYWDGSTAQWADLQAFRTYSYDVTYATGTTINLSQDWKVAVGRYKCDDWTGTTGTMETQTKSDSLTWENGTTVRFRAWSRSNLVGCLTSGTAGSYYPDFCIADWVTVSGPSLGIPLVLRHIGSRIAFTAKAGNQFQSVEICLNKADYMQTDNADSHEHDEADKMTDEQAQKVVEAVNAVYNRMCMPAGVDLQTGTLRGMTTTLYDDLNAHNAFGTIEQKTTDDGLVSYDTMSPSDIATNVKHPAFCSVDGRMYMITIPYDMSNDPDTQGEVLTLPAQTRFRIRLRDVNNGDHTLSTPNYEYREHIFSLSDIKKADGTPQFPNGLEMLLGKSYRFTVGYLYDKLTVTVIEEGIDWQTAGEESGESSDQHVAESTEGKYQWYRDAINTAIDYTKESRDYNPVFKISTAEEFKEFVALVNGTAATKTDGLARATRSQDNPDADPDRDSNESKKYWWYDTERTAVSLAAGGDTIWVTRAQAEALGYVMYRHYYPQISDKSAYSVEDYVRGPVSFYDEQVNLHLVVQLTQDIDLHDWQLESIGKAADAPFKGFFDGGTHTLSNVNVRDEYLFGHMQDGEIRDLRLTSTHKLALLRSGTTSSNVRNLRIVGISLQADCSGSPIAGSLAGLSYVVGCIHEGDAGGALIGVADNMYMYGCMHACSNITGGALLGGYASASTFLAPQMGKVLSWGRFMCNYYQHNFNQSTNAVAAIADKYRPQEYIRGARQHILRAKNDNLLSDDMPYDKLSAMQKEEFYGLAPWRAMNYAIYQYNQMSVAQASEYHSFPESHKCHMMYGVDNIGYAHRYPQLVACPDGDDGKPGVPTNQGVKNILLLNN